MQVSDFVLDALDTVLSWDLPDDVCSDAVATQACLLAGVEPEDMWGYAVDVTVH
jgi:hypothetical protein